jgi:hypothetical protein
MVNNVTANNVIDGRRHEGICALILNTGDACTCRSPFPIQWDAELDHNANMERAELAQWSERPDLFTAYFTFPNDKTGGPYRRSFCPSIVDARVTTWPGTIIGRITDARVFAHNFGGRVVWLSVTGTNGAEYHGRASWDNGNVIALRKVK